VVAAAVVTVTTAESSPLWIAIGEAAYVREHGLPWAREVGRVMGQQERRDIVANQYIAALSSPNEETLAALASLLADDVRAAGMSGSGKGRDAVIASTAAPPYPLLASAEWGALETDGDVTSVRGTRPWPSATSIRGSVVSQSSWMSTRW
jgi:hypothetical protein